MPALKCKSLNFLIESTTPQISSSRSSMEDPPWRPPPPRRTPAVSLEDDLPYSYPLSNSCFSFSFFFNHCCHFFPSFPLSDPSQFLSWHAEESGRGQIGLEKLYLAGTAEGLRVATRLQSLTSSFLQAPGSVTSHTPSLPG